MLRSVSSRIALTLGLGGLVLLLGCGSKYPACASDEDCNREQNRHEFCVNQLCQKCRDDKDCKEGEACNKGRCDAIAGWCKDDSGCGDGAVCLGNRCQACSSDSQCGEGGKCKSGKCLRKGSCTSDDECSPSEDCRGGRCVPAAPRAASQDAPCRLSSVFFDFNESVLSTDATTAIDGNAECLKRVGRPAELIGRSDPRGTEEYNLALSERRAISVRERLVRLGLDGRKLRTLPKGELEARGRDEAGWAQDRRVDFEWR